MSARPSSEEEDATRKYSECTPLPPLHVVWSAPYTLQHMLSGAFFGTEVLSGAFFYADSYAGAVVRFGPPKGGPHSLVLQTEKHIPRCSTSVE